MTRPGTESGITTRKKVRRGEAPSVAEAASSLRSTDENEAAKGGERERESVSGDGLPPASERTAGAEGDKQIKSEDGRGQHNRQGD